MSDDEIVSLHTFPVALNKLVANRRGRDWAFGDGEAFWRATTLYDVLDQMSWCDWAPVEIGLAESAEWDFCAPDSVEIADWLGSAAALDDVVDCILQGVSDCVYDSARQEFEDATDYLEYDRKALAAVISETLAAHGAEIPAIVTSGCVAETAPLVGALEAAIKHWLAGPSRPVLRGYFQVSDNFELSARQYADLRASILLSRNPAWDHAETEYGCAGYFDYTRGWPFISAIVTTRDAVERAS